MAARVLGFLPCAQLMIDVIAERGCTNPDKPVLNWANVCSRTSWEYSANLVGS